MLEDRLDEPERRHLLRAPADQALRLLLWSSVHGFAVLAIETQLEPDVGQRVLDVLRGVLAQEPTSRSGRDRGSARTTAGSH